MLPTSLAVHMKSTLERSTGKSRKLSTKNLFYSGSSISNKVDYGSPNKCPDDVLSISSKTITQFSELVSFRASIIFPGLAPT